MTTSKKPPSKTSPEDEAAFRGFAIAAAKKEECRIRQHLSKMLTAAGVGPADRRKYGRLLRKGGPKLEAFQAELAARVEKPVEDESPGEPPARDEAPAAPESSLEFWGSLLEEDHPGVLIQDRPQYRAELERHADEFMTATADHFENLVGAFEDVEEGLVAELEDIRESAEEEEGR